MTGILFWKFPSPGIFFLPYPEIPPVGPTFPFLEISFFGNFDLPSYPWPRSLPNWEGLAMALSPCLGS